MISSQHYQTITMIWSHNGRRGGQELILPEILSTLLAYNITSIWLPFFTSGTLAARCMYHHINVIANTNSDTWDKVPSETFDAVYFGTPTIVDGQLLFPDSVMGPEPTGGWNAATERMLVRKLCMELPDDCRLVLSGLGSGDITYDQRFQDLCTLVTKGFMSPQLICMKKFEDFSDYLFGAVRESYGG